MVEFGRYGNSLEGNENVRGLGLQLAECLSSMQEALGALASPHGTFTEHSEAHL